MVDRVQVSARPGQRLGGWTIFKVVLSLGLLVIAFSQASWEDLLALWQHIDLMWLVPSLLMYLIILWVGARRTWRLLGKPMPFRELLSVVVLQTAMSNLIATLVGTVSYVAMTRARYQIDLKSSIGSVLWSRWGDLAVALPVLAVATMLLWHQLDLLRVPVVILVVAVLLLVLLGLAVLFGERAAEQGSLYLTRTFRTRHWARSVERAASALSGQGASFRGERFRRLLFDSTILMLVQLLYAYAMARLLVLPFDLVVILFCFVFILLISFVPIGILGGLGVYEVSAIVIYGTFGLSSGAALAVALGTRLFLFGVSALILVLPVMLGHDQKG